MKNYFLSQFKVSLSLLSFASTSESCCCNCCMKFHIHRFLLTFAKVLITTMSISHQCFFAICVQGFGFLKFHVCCCSISSGFFFYKPIKFILFIVTSTDLSFRRWWKIKVTKCSTKTSPMSNCCIERHCLSYRVPCATLFWTFNILKFSIKLCQLSAPEAFSFTSCWAFGFWIGQI